MNKNLDSIMNSPFELSSLLDSYTPELFYRTREKNAIARRILTVDHLNNVNATKNFNNKRYVVYQKDVFSNAAFRRDGTNIITQEDDEINVPLFELTTDAFRVNIENLVNTIYGTEYLVWHHPEIIGKQMWERENKTVISLLEAITHYQGSVIKSEEVSRETITKLKNAITQYVLPCKNLLAHPDYRDIIEVLQDRNVLTGIDVLYCDQMNKNRLYMLADPAFVGAMPILHEPTLEIRPADEQFTVFVNYQEEVGMYIASHKSVACLEIDTNGER